MLEGVLYVLEAVKDMRRMLEVLEVVVKALEVVMKALEVVLKVLEGVCYVLEERDVRDVLCCYSVWRLEGVRRILPYMLEAVKGELYLLEIRCVLICCRLTSVVFCGSFLVIYRPPPTPPSLANSPCEHIHDHPSSIHTAYNGACSVQSQIAT